MEFQNNVAFLGKLELRVLLAFTSKKPIPFRMDIVWFRPRIGLVEVMDNTRALRMWSPTHQSKVEICGVPREHLALLSKYGKSSSKFRIDFQTLVSEVWDDDQCQLGLPFRPEPGTPPAFEHLGFDLQRGSHKASWKLKAPSMEGIGLLQTAWAQATQTFDQLHLIKMEAPDKNDTLRLTLGEPGKPHCWQMLTVVADH